MQIEDNEKVKKDGMRSSVLVIGLDGATFKIIKPCLEQGYLPTLQELIKHGICGELVSTIPPLSIYSWPTFYTGTNAGKLGIFALSGVNKVRNLREVEQKTANFTHVRTKSLWKILSENNKKVGVVNIPVTYPPEDVNGFLISGFLTPSPESNYTFPSELKESLKDYNYKIDIEFGNRLGIIPDSGVDKKDMLEQLYHIADKRCDTCCKLIREWKPDFFIVNFKEVDVMQHLFWNEKQVISNYLQKIDEYIDHLKEVMNPDVTIVMSDHGFHSRSTKYFHINTWLYERGYLMPNTKMKGRMQVGMYNIGLNLSSRFDLLRRIIPNRFKEWVMSEEQVTNQIDWQNTKAFGTRWGLYINTDIVAEGEYDILKEKIVTDLKIASDNSKKIFQEVLQKEEIFSGPYSEGLPDVVFLPDSDYKVNPNIHQRIVTRRIDSPDKTGDHNADPDGILIVDGIDVAKNKKIDNAMLMDLAPTILHMMGISIPSDMDGKVLKGIFEEKSEVAKREVVYQEISEKTRIGQKIKGLKGVGKI